MAKPFLGFIKKNCFNTLVFGKTKTSPKLSFRKPAFRKKRSRPLGEREEKRSCKALKKTCPNLPSGNLRKRRLFLERKLG